MDADETVECIAHDLSAPPAAEVAGGPGLRRLLAERCVRAVDWGGWQRIDAEEVRRGAAEGKPREKIVKVEDMVHVACGSSLPG
jgi:hypothetical protein